MTEAMGGPTVVTRTLLLLPTVVGLAGIAMTVVTGVLGGVTDGPQGWAATAVAALAVLVTVLTGGSYGLYAGLTILAVGGLVADGGPNALEITLLPICILIVHEVIRFSLDARRPSRFGPGVIVGYISRLVVGCLLVAAASGLVQVIIGRAPAGGAWVPVGLAAAAIPLFIRRGAEILDGQTVLGTTASRVAIGVMLIAVTISLVTIGAEAQTESDAATQTTETAQTTTTTIDVPTATADGDETSITVPGWAVVLVVILLGVMIYLILQRDEAIFELEDVDRRVEDNAFDMAVGQLGDQENELVEVDEDVLARLLSDLQLDISAEADPGRAIRFGYAKIEQRLADMRLTRTVVETEREFLIRAIPTLGSAGEAMTTLTRLFERARFGHEPVDENMRGQALDAIETLIERVVDDSSKKASGGEAR